MPVTGDREKEAQAADAVTRDGTVTGDRDATLLEFHQLRGLGIFPGGDAFRGKEIILRRLVSGAPRRAYT